MSKNPLNDKKFRDGLKKEGIEAAKDVGNEVTGWGTALFETIFPPKKKKPEMHVIWVKRK